MHEVYEFLKQCGTYYLATDEAGQPRVRPFGTVNLFEGKLYIQMGKSKAVSRQIAQNPRVELCGLQGEQWVRVSAPWWRTTVWSRNAPCSRSIPICDACISQATATFRCFSSRTQRQPSPRLSASRALSHFKGRKKEKAGEPLALKNGFRRGVLLAFKRDGLLRQCSPFI